ncbi:MAG: lamin tail domain-containing protein [Verrucomicrobia bacterium]|nr:lamin tail domain-containing protein [Verrucomicrobiota bacterium]
MNLKIPALLLLAALGPSLNAAVPLVTNVFPANLSNTRSLGQVEVNFSQAVKGVDAADLLINGAPATNLLIRPGGACTFQFPPPPAGRVGFTWAAGHGITDYSVNPVAFVTNAWSCTLDPTITYPALRITELCAANRTGFLDEDGLASDWLEIFNPNSNAVSLAGWSLSDDPAEPGKWVFPARTLNAGQYLLLFASAKDRKAPTGTNRLHLNFTLSGSGEFLGLFSSESPRVLQAGFDPAYPEQRNDCSYGLDASNCWRYFATPTPEAANPASAVTDFVRPVHFSVERGFFTQPFDLVLTTPTPGATIRFTLDGGEPRVNSGFAYTNSLRLSTTAVLRAAAFRPGLAPSPIRTHTYLFNASAAVASLPVLSIVTPTNNLIGPTGITGISVSNYVSGVWTALLPTDYDNNLKFGIPWERAVSAEYIEPQDNRGFQIDCGIRVQGSDYTRPRYTWTSKFSYRLYFRGDYGAGELEFPLFPTSPLSSFDSISLRAGHNDISNPFTKDELSRRLHADMGQSAAQGTFVNLFVNGVYKGYYNPCERVDEDSLEAWDGTGSDWDRITVNSVVQTGDNAAWTDLRNVFSAGQDLRNPAVYQGVARRLDLVNFVDYLLIEIYGANWDWPQNNWRAGRERSTNGLWRFYCWDVEAAFDIGQRPPEVDVWTTTNRVALGPSTGEIATFLRGLTNNLEFRLLFADRIQKHFFNGGALTDGHITNRFLEMKSVLAGVIPSMNLQVITNWVPRRRVPLFAQFNTYGLYVSNAPVFNQHGGRVLSGFGLTMSAPLAGTIYFTLAGADPREAFTGAVATNARPFTNAVSLVTSAVVKARTRTGTNWSALTEAEFQVASLVTPLRFTEINYNPPGGSAYEFVEMKNTGAVPVDLSDLSFDGINFTFQNSSSLAPGAILVLANNNAPALFAARYTNTTVFGWFGGSLNNAGERLALKDRDGNVLLSVTYDNAPPWPVAADGGGSSLEIVDPTGDPHDVLNWRASGQPYGSPGSVLASPSLTPPVRISEVMACNVARVNHDGTFPDWVELLNASGASRDLEGFSLTDDADPRKFVFPVGTALAADSLLVVWCDAATNTTSGLHTGFALSREGGTLFLFDAQTNLVDAMSYGPQAADFSVARSSAAELDFRLAIPTPGASNSFPLPDAPTNLVINEWLANPAPGGFDWIELFNRSTNAPVELRDLCLSVGNAVQRIESLSFVAPGGFVRLFLDDVMAPDHLDLPLPASGSTLTLYERTGNQIDRVTYGAQTEGVSRGRLPDGSATVTNFVGTASPSAPNYVRPYAGPVLNEVLARNVFAVTNSGRTPDFVELFNPTPTNFSLGGMSLSVNEPKPGQFRFSPAATLAPNGFLVVWCDAERPASTNAPVFNTGRTLDGDSGGVWLFNPAGQVVDFVEYGFQVADKPIGLNSGQWRLLALPTPGLANSAAQPLAADSALRLNEWMAQPVRGPDWFEVFNTANLPAELSGRFVSDDPSSSGLTDHPIAPLSFIGATNWVRFVADGNESQGHDHVGFNLAGEGETLWLVRTNAGAVSVIDSISFAAQKPGVAQGRWPDGSTNLVSFPGSASPAAANYLLVPCVVISEVLPRATPPLEPAIELFNPTEFPADVSGFFLSNGQSDFRQYRLAANSIVPPGGFLVVSEGQFTNAAPRGFKLDALHGGEVWLSSADSAGKLTGYRVGAKYGPAAPNLSFGPVVCSVGTDFAALAAPTIAASNAPPLVGPVVLSEVMYHAAPGPDDALEFIELRNITDADAPLFDPARPTNTWRLRGGLSFDFPPGLTLPAGGFVLVVNFDPADPVAEWNFRSQFSVPWSVPVLGPLVGALDNAGDAVLLQAPAEPLAGSVPYVTADQLAYTDCVPWPVAADGGGASLQRREPARYGNEPLNWLAAAPTPGTANHAGDFPVILQSPQSQTANERQSAGFTVRASAPVPPAYQWRFNGVNLADATNDVLWLDWLVCDLEGNYDVIVSSAAGSAISAPAHLNVISPPEILVAPTNVLPRVGSNAVFTVIAGGAPPLRYQWRLDGALLPGEASTTLLRTNAQFADEGVYEVTVSNEDGVATASAALRIQIPTGILQPPLAQMVAPGERVTLSVIATGAPMPLLFEWRIGSSAVRSNLSDLRIDFYTFTAPAYPTQQNYRVVVRNPATQSAFGSVYAPLVVAADGDGDGLPDPWEAAWGFPTNSPANRDLDSDGDGVNDWREYVAGTNPTDANSVLRLDLVLQTNGVGLAFLASSNKTYSVQSSDTVAPGAWQNLADVVATASNVTRRFFDARPATNRFYRVVAPAWP